MDVACSTFCFDGDSLDRALRRMTELEFTRVDLGVGGARPHIQPSELAGDLNVILARLRQGPTVSVAGVTLRLNGASEESLLVEGAARLAKQLATAVVTIEPNASNGDMESEIARLSGFQRICNREGVVLAVLTKQGTPTATPTGAVELCRRLPGVGLSFDPSHFVMQGVQQDDWEPIYPFVRHLFLRDSTRALGLFQTAVGRGEIDYSRIVFLLQKQNYRGAMVVDFESHFGGDVDPPLEARKLGRVLESLL